MTDAEIKKALEKAINEYAAEDVGSLEYFKLIITILDLFNRKQAEIEKQSQNFKELVSDYRVLQQSFDNLKGLYEDEKSKVEKTKEKCIFFRKKLQKAEAEIDRVTAFAADVVEVKHGEWSYEYSGDKLGGTDATYDYRCSVCDEFALEESNYCPNCGAKMDRKEKADV